MREIREAATPVFGSYFGSICNSEPTARFPPETGEQPRRRRRRRRGDDEGFKYPLTNVPVACFVLGFLDETGEQPTIRAGESRQVSPQYLRRPRMALFPSRAACRAPCTRGTVGGWPFSCTGCLGKRFRWGEQLLMPQSRSECGSGLLMRVFPEKKASGHQGGLTRRP